LEDFHYYLYRQLKGGGMEITGIQEGNAVRRT